MAERSTVPRRRTLDNQQTGPLSVCRLDGVE
jgi:hypothetical protein